MKTKTTTNPSTYSKVWRIVLCVAIPLAVGGIAAALTGSAMKSFQQMNQPQLSPPAWLFQVVWTILYVLMGLASYMIWSAEHSVFRNHSNVRNWLIVYGLSLVFNFCWSPVFFNLNWFWFAFVWLLALWGMIIYLVIKASSISMAAMWMMVVYLLG
ncbi:TspO/MBR family protein [Dubosiella newyorkensis]|uniref:TspO/MBR family protein n=1 Tax=Dubosiella newyorkensis TaxID=1862672 RepID=UPI0026F39762|nr:TspO/MBR family protein [Dubosiella newyorkensis]